MKRSITLIPIAVFTIWSFLLATACSNGPQNTNLALNQNGPVNGNTQTPTPAAIEKDSACNDNTLPPQRAAAVQAAIDSKIALPANKDLADQKAAGKFAYRVVVAPQGTDPNPPQALALIIGGSIAAQGGRNVFQTLIPVLQPFMAQKCVMRVVFVPLSVVTEKDATFLTALPDGFGWSGCDYPAVACPNGMCADAGSCNGGIGGKSGGRASTEDAPASAPAAAAKSGPPAKP